MAKFVVIKDQKTGEILVNIDQILFIEKPKGVDYVSVVFANYSNPVPFYHDFEQLKKLLVQ